MEKQSMDPRPEQNDSSPPAITADDELQVLSDQSAADKDESLEAGKAEKAVPERSIMTAEPTGEAEKLRITSSLGGSARELLNEDGTQR